MDRVQFQNARGLTLIANYRSAGSAPVVILVHGFGSDKSANGRFDRLAKALWLRGYSTLAFDLSGCGESDSDTLTLKKFVDDLQSAIFFAKARGATSVGLVGHSLGAVTCLQIFPADIGAMVLTGAMAGRHSFDLAVEDMEEVAVKGYFTIEVCQPGAPLALRADIQLEIECKNLNPKSLFSDVSCPVLLIYGSQDTWISRAQIGLQYVKSHANLEILPGDNHNLYRRYDQVIELSIQWFDRYLPL